MAFIRTCRDVFIISLLSFGGLAAQGVPGPGPPTAPINDYIPHLLIFGLILCSAYLYHRKRKLQKS